MAHIPLQQGFGNPNVRASSVQPSMFKEGPVQTSESGKSSVLRTGPVPANSKLSRVNSGTKQKKSATTVPKRKLKKKRVISGYPMDTDLVQLIPILKHSEIVLLLILRSFINPKHPTMTIWASERTLAEKMRGWESTSNSRGILSRPLKRLQQLGIVLGEPMTQERWNELRKKVGMRAKRNPRQNEYRILFPWEKQVLDLLALAQFEASHLPQIEAFSPPQSEASHVPQTEAENKQLENNQKENNQEKNNQEKAESDVLVQDSCTNTNFIENKTVRKGKKVTKLPSNSPAYSLPAYAQEEPIPEDFFKLFSGGAHSHLDNPLPDRELEDECEETAGNFLAFQWDSRGAKPGHAAIKIHKRAYRAGKIPDTYRPENFERFMAERRKKANSDGNRIMNHIQDLILRLYPSQGVRQPRRWTSGTYEKAHKFLLEIERARTILRFEHCLTWELVLKAVVALWPELDKQFFGYGTEKIISFQTFFGSRMYIYRWFADWEEEHSDFYRFLAGDEEGRTSEL